MRACLAALARDLEERLVGVLLDRAAYLHAPDVDRLRRDLDRLRVGDLRDERCRRILAALRTLADAATVPTIEAVARESGVPVAHVRRIHDFVVDGAIVHLEAIEDALLDVRRRIEIATLGLVLLVMANQDAA
jgi:hypothetical protein